MGLWFSIFPNVQSLTAQGLAALLVIGSYALVPSVTAWRSRSRKDTFCGH
jgi:high-affinity iron transporter